MGGYRGTREYVYLAMSSFFLTLMVNEDEVYEGEAPFIKKYNDQLESWGIPEWHPPSFS